MMTKRGKSTGAELVLCAPMDAGGRSIGACDLNDLNRPFDSRSSSHNKFAYVRNTSFVMARLHILLDHTVPGLFHSMLDLSRPADRR
jgi:hypothetical protein